MEKLHLEDTNKDPSISIPCPSLHLKYRHLSSIWLAPRSQQRRQLNNLPSQVKTQNLSTPGGSSYNNLLAFPVLIPDYFADNKIRKTFSSECSLYVGQIYIKNDSLS
ncbi:hypothetical protein AMECASPLE_011391 [Ameca splendens]|uniref:Uncharacterized protein n=1 Tax=Ameca splendens TaxID=208324 RepID=A0ABV0ZBC5_9TELE